MKKTQLKICLIPAAGEGIRARPYTTLLPKAMLEVGGKPLLQNTIELVRDQLGITSFIIVTGHLSETIQGYFADGRGLDVSIRYINNTSINKGLAWSIYLGSAYINERFLVILGDEYYNNSNHYILKSKLHDNCLALCGIIESGDTLQIRQNYTIDAIGNRIKRIYEKPANVHSKMMGTGTFIFSEEIFSHIAEEYNRKGQSADFMHLLDELCRKGHVFERFLLSGDYVNVNDLASLEKAKKLYSKSMGETRE